MNCKKCGARMRKTDKYCPNCHAYNHEYVKSYGGKSSKKPTSSSSVNSASNAVKSVEQIARKLPAWVTVVAIILVAAIVVGYFIYTKNNRDNNSPKEPQFVAAEGTMSFHFLELGNSFAGDCIYIKAGDTDILIDAGSSTSSLTTIRNYVDNYCTDGILEYVIATHADEDHIACFGGTTSANSSLFDYYECKVIIDFALTDKNTKIYNRYVAKRDAEVAAGAKHFTALECYNQSKDGAQKKYELGDGMYMEILYNYYYDHHAADENNYSVCTLFSHGSRKFLLTGDLEESGEEYLVQNNDLPTNIELFKAGHHGSPTSSNDCLLSVIKPKICAVSCCAGSVQYTQNFSNTFPAQEFINRIAPYTDKVYVTTTVDVKYDADIGKYVNDGAYKMLNGNIVVVSDEDEVRVNCSNNNVLLKDTAWFAANRAMPTSWAA